MNIKDLNKIQNFVDREVDLLKLFNSIKTPQDLQDLLSQSNQEIVKGKTNYHIYRNGDMVHIEHSKTDSSGIGFSVNQLDGIIQKLTQLKLLVKNKE